jgi:SAM-dependent methyltransferase
MHIAFEAAFRVLSGALLAGFLSNWAAAQTLQRDVIYVPTPQPVVDRMLEMAKVTKDDLVFDLGSGDGRIAISAGKLGARAVGIEIDPERLREANDNLKASSLQERVSFRNADLFKTDFKEATVLTLYLLNALNLRLRPTILEMKPGTRVVSHAFHMAEWEADQEDVVENRRIFLWYVPARAEGKWQIRTPEGNATLELKQQFQKLSGTAKIGDTTVPISNASLRGDLITFSIQTEGGPMTLTGTVRDGRIEGQGGRWNASRD